MTNTIKHMDSIDLIRFDIDDTVKNNFNKYQDSLEKHPEIFKVLKLLYDQYLKTLPLYRREQESEDTHDIIFETVK